MKLLLLALLLSGCLAQTVPTNSADLCGSWESTCQTDGTQSWQTRLVLDGISTGGYELIILYHRSTNCSGAPGLEISMGALWLDLGVNPAFNATSRTYQIAAMSLVVTPTDQTAVDFLTVACPCGDNWEINGTRALSYCAPGDCQNTTWFGGTEYPKYNGVSIGSPAFGWYDIQNGTNNAIFSRIDSVQATVATLQDQFTSGTHTTICDPALPSPAFCGDWVQDCGPIQLPGTAALSTTSSFSYQGPQNDPFEAGEYILNRTYFLDDGCQVPYMTIYEQGTFQNPGASPSVSDGYEVVKFPAYVIVTPLMDDAAQELEEVCPCGDPSLWHVNVFRQLTTCPPNNCTVPWNYRQPLGSVLYGSAMRLDRSSSEDHELRFSVLNADQATGYNTPITEFAYDFQSSTCLYPGDSGGSLCGTWQLPCSASPDGTDVSITYRFTGQAATGDPGDQGMGTFDRWFTVFKPGTNCVPGNEIVALQENGYWSDMGNTTAGAIVPGGRQILVSFPSTYVDPSDQSVVDQLNNADTGCPCGSTWQLNQPRMITTCPARTCPATNITYFKGGDLGQPGYGVFRVADGVFGIEDNLRLSILATDPSGYYNILDTYIVPIPREASCTTPTYSTQYTAMWYQSCRSDSDILSDYDFEALAYFTPEGTYNISSDKFRPGYGCNETVLEMYHRGKWSNKGSTEVVTSGSKIQLDVEYIEMTPYTDDITTMLHTYCPCISWGTGIKVKYNKKNPCTPCNAHPFLAMDLVASTQYGIFQRRDQMIGFLRMSDFYSSSDQGWNSAFEPYDYDWAQIRSLPPSPSPSGGMDAGSVLLLIAFVGAFVYFVGGIAINYFSSGVVKLPHAEFWNSMPGLIAEGFVFTLSGFKSGSAGRGVSSTGSAESYKPVASKSGYGAL